MVRKAMSPGVGSELSWSSLTDGKGVNMSIGSPKDTIRAAGTGPAAAGATSGKAVGELLARIKDGSPDVRTQAWLGAGGIGAAAVRPLSGVMTDQDLEIARAAKRALWEIVHHAGRPGAQDEKRAVASELIELL